MKSTLKCVLLCFFCLATLLLIPGLTPKSYAATSTPSRPHSGGFCDLYDGDPVNTDTSSDANAYTRLPDVDTFPEDTDVGIFRFAGSNAPAIGAEGCTTGGITLYLSNRGSWYNVRTTVNGVTTQSIEQPDLTPDFYQLDMIPTPDGTYMRFVMGFDLHQQYSFKAQSCTQGFRQRLPLCSAWSPTIQVTLAENPSCQDGYVWREAASFDRVCVTPDQQAQAAYDNSQASSRIDPSGASGPQSCIAGYVWRLAFGGDDVCVTPDQQAQTAYDNSQALTRIIAF